MNEINKKGKVGKEGNLIDNIFVCLFVVVADKVFSFSLYTVGYFRKHPHPWTDGVVF